MYPATGSGSGALRMAIRSPTVQGACTWLKACTASPSWSGPAPSSWEKAAQLAIETASSSLRDLRVAEVVKLDMTVENGKVARFRTRINVSFKYENE